MEGAKRETTMRTLLGVVSLLAVLAGRGAEGHGRLWDPPARSSMWRRGYDNPTNYQDNELFCGGFQHQWYGQDGRCGLCGDPYDGVRENEANGKYANGVIARDYREGETVTVDVDVTANHKGWFEFRMCPTNDLYAPETQTCFDQFPLQLADGSGVRYQLPDHDSRMFSVDVVLPAGLVCTQCVLQWKYHTGNSWGTDPDGHACVGCGPQEEFYGCADVSITSGGPTQSTPSTTSTSITTPAAPTSSPTPSTANPTPSTDSPTAAPTAPPSGRCRAVPPYHRVPGMDNWCVINCSLGFCPPSHCACVGKRN